MPSDRRNLIMAKATDLIFSLLDIASVREVLFGIPQYVQLGRVAPFLSFDEVCMGSPVLFYKKKSYKQVHKNFWNFQLE